MKNPKPKIDVENIVKTINENLVALREGFDPAKLTQSAREEILEEIIKLKDLALKVKTDLNNVK